MSRQKKEDALRDLPSLHLKLDAELILKIKQIALKQDIYVSELCATILEKFVEKNEKRVDKSK